MDLPSYIDQIGIAKAAAEFGVAYRTAASWRARERFPKKETAREIEKRTKRKVTFAECYQ
jgi:hypothetical protein